MLLIIPIRTESTPRRTPIVNYCLIGVNAFVFLLLDGVLRGESVAAFKTQYLTLHADAPTLYQFFTYQFIHADLMHLLGNMLFLWVFGNSVNAKMGNLVYAFYYLAGGIFAAWGFALIATGPTHLLGASGAIGAVTTAYLVLYPRSRVTVLIWLFIFIHFIEVPALLLIGLKIIVWDNIVAPRFGGSEAVAHSAHLAGYLFGFVTALTMLFIRALPRDQFDILALWKRWNQRREFSSAMSEPDAAARAQYGAAARVETADPKQREAEERNLDEITDLRTRITEHFSDGNVAQAAALYEELITVDPQQCLSQDRQLQIAREFYGAGRSAEAAAAFDRFVECYSNSTEATDIRLLLGIIYARDLRQFEVADKHLTESMTTLRDESRRDQCAEWLRHVRLALGRPEP